MGKLKAPMRLCILLACAYALGGLMHGFPNNYIQGAGPVIFGAVCGFTARRILLQFVLEGMRVSRMTTGLLTTVVYSHSTVGCACNHCTLQRRIDSTLLTNVDEAEPED